MLITSLELKIHCVENFDIFGNRKTDPRIISYEVRDSYSSPELLVLRIKRKNGWKCPVKKAQLHVLLQIFKVRYDKCILIQQRLIRFFSPKIVINSLWDYASIPTLMIRHKTRRKNDLNLEQKSYPGYSYKNQYPFTIPGIETSML